MKSKGTNVRFIASTGMLSAVAFILMYLEIAIPIMPEFIKFDFSDLPALIGAFAFGPLCGVVISLIKNLLHLAFSHSMLVGELSNFILGAVFTATAGWIYKSKKTKKRALIGGIVGALVMGVFSIISNYFVVYPAYYAAGFDKEAVLGLYNAIAQGAMKNIFQCLICFNLPFTIVKGLIAVAITMLIYKPLSIIIKGRN